MRIPSPFNQDSLYRPENRYRGSREAYRRLTRLVLGLALVVVVMRQASQPSTYQAFFDPSIATGLSELQYGDPSFPNQGASPDSDAASIDDVNRPATAEIIADDREIARRIVADLLPTDQQQWWTAMWRWQHGDAAPPIPSTLGSILATLDSLEGLSDPQRSAWQSMFNSYSTLAPLSTSFALDPSLIRDPTSSPAETSDSDSDSDSEVSLVAPNSEDLPRVRAMLAALDAAAWDLVVDGSIWRSGDIDSLYRLLIQAESIGPTNLPPIGVIPLLQQPEVFRNQWVRIDGRVARAERIEAQDNPYGVSHYWQLWLRPDDGADRPIVSIVPSVPQSVAAVGAEATRMEGPEIVVFGKYLKRLAYQSGVGADLAPVIVGRILVAPLSESELAADSTLSDASNTDPSWWPILLACLLGVASAAWVMWRTAASAQRARSLRRRYHREPSEFLDEISLIDGKDTNHNTSENR